MGLKKHTFLTVDDVINKESFRICVQCHAFTLFRRVTELWTPALSTIFVGRQPRGLKKSECLQQNKSNQGILRFGNGIRKALNPNLRNFCVAKSFLGLDYDARTQQLLLRHQRKLQKCNHAGMWWIWHIRLLKAMQLVHCHENTNKTYVIKLNPLQWI